MDKNSIDRVIQILKIKNGLVYDRQEPKSVNIITWPAERSTEVTQCIYIFRFNSKGGKFKIKFY